ncbi:patched family protein [Necator americanus]|uniref:Patched family protein n=1 Tax=Necator americanus TaxID=51031 RepID=W2T0Y1_NECAM|nr:patched family protein [Necator americanus]ETN75219.1 patched family protein [Necator americanus]
MPSLLSEYGKRFEDWMVEAFYQYGLILGKHPFWFLWGPLIFTACCTPGLFWLKINLDLYKLFVPTDAPVRYEFERSLEFDRMPAGDLTSNGPIKGGKRNQKRRPREIFDIQDIEMDRLRQDLELLILDQAELNITRIKRQTKMDPHKEEMMVKKAQVRRSKAPIKNDILRFYVVHKNFDNLLQSKYLGPLYEYTNKMMKVTMEFRGEHYDLEDFCQKDAAQKECDNNLNVWIKHADVLFKDGKIKTNPNLQLSYPVLYLFNRPKDIGNVIYGVDVKGEKNEIQGARVLTLHWFIQYPGSPENNAAYYQFRETLMDFWRKIMEETEFEFIPHKSKPLEMYLGVWSVILALICTFGIFFFLGVAFNPVTSTMPFLVLAVGIDDDFLMIAAWRELDRKIPLHQRVALVMADAGASITVSTNFWMWQYQQYLNDFPDVDYQKDFYNKKYLRDFFNQIDYSQYRDNVKFLNNVSNGEPCIAAFAFETSYYGLDSWDKRQAELFHWRAILDEYPDFDMFLAGIFSPFLIDQRHTIAPSSMQTIGSALAMMALISFFFLPDAASQILVFCQDPEAIIYLNLTTPITAICFSHDMVAVVNFNGGLRWFSNAWIGFRFCQFFFSMGCIVMAIGLAVDYSVHICYRYHRSEYTKASDKVRDTLCSVAWPITQAVTSTLFGLSSTAFVPAYLVRVFFQTVYLVNIIGPDFKPRLNMLSDIEYF